MKMTPAQRAVPASPRVRAIFRAINRTVNIFEDRREYDADDLARAYDLLPCDAQHLYAMIHADDETPTEK